MRRPNLGLQRGVAVLQQTKYGERRSPLPDVTMAVVPQRKERPTPGSTPLLRPTARTARVRIPGAAPIHTLAIGRGRKNAFVLAALVAALKA